MAHSYPLADRPSTTVADTPPVAESKSVTSETIERARDMLKRAWRLLSRRLYPPSLQVLLCVLLVLLGVCSRCSTYRISLCGTTQTTPAMRVSSAAGW